MRRGPPRPQSAANAGAHPSVVVTALDGKDDCGFDAATGEFGNLSAGGILDPAKVTRAALQNAVSVAGLVLTTSCAVVESFQSTGADTRRETVEEQR
jgi:chaperonin GroEL